MCYQVVNENNLQRALMRSRRQAEIGRGQRFRYKEAISDELDAQFKSIVPNLCSDDSLNKVYTFAEDALKWVIKNENVLDTLFGPASLSPSPNHINKNQPPLKEAIIATLARYELLANYLPAFRKCDIGIILGGSSSYGKFFNIRQCSGGNNIIGEPPSDIDLLIVCDYKDIPLILNMVKTRDDIIYGLKPLMDFIEFNVNKFPGADDHIVVSKKYNITRKSNIANMFFKTKELSFPLSLHIMQKKTFNMLTHPVDEIHNGEIPAIRDIRMDEEISRFLVFSSMEGINVPEAYANNNYNQNIISFGRSSSTVHERKMSPYLYWEGRYVSGVYQNLILPCFEVLLDDLSLNISDNIRAFKKFLSNRYILETNRFADSLIKLHKMHPRYPIFKRSLCEKLNSHVEQRVTTNKASIVRSYSNSDALSFRKYFHNKYGTFDMHEHICCQLKNNRKDLNILDLGCGNGDLLVYLRAKALVEGKFVGIDVNTQWPSSISYRYDISFIEGRVQELDWLLQTKYQGKLFFDVIIASHMLYHIDDVNSLIEKAVMWLKEEGQFIASTNSNQSLVALHGILRQVLMKKNIGVFLNQYNNFSAENAQDIFREFFRTVNMVIEEDEIENIDPNDAVKYIESSYDNYDVPLEQEIRSDLSKAIREETHLLHDVGKLHDRKIVAVITGKNPVKVLP